VGLPMMIHNGLGLRLLSIYNIRLIVDKFQSNLAKTGENDSPVTYDLSWDLRLYGYDVFYPNRNRNRNYAVITEKYRKFVLYGLYG
jgi:hypothetical protein